jgi:hypothetical protein
MSSDEDRAANAAANAGLLRAADKLLVGGTSGRGRKHDSEYENFIFWL